jgi:hypothetical protein
MRSSSIGGQICRFDLDIAQPNLDNRGSPQPLKSPPRRRAGQRVLCPFEIGSLENLQEYLGPTAFSRTPLIVALLKGRAMAGIIQFRENPARVAIAIEVQRWVSPARLDPDVYVAGTFHSSALRSTAADYVDSDAPVGCAACVLGSGAAANDGSAPHELAQLR